jgi:glucose/arabinose dehydrogenase
VKQALPGFIDVAGGPITLAFASDGSVFFSERITGNLWQYNQGEYRLVKHFSIVPITGHHETGLLGIALDPKFAANGFIYCFYTYGLSETNMHNKVVRIKANNPAETIIIDNLPAGRIHNGGVIAFGPNNNLYIGVGVQNEIMNKSQDLTHLGGKILRIKADGSIPKDNPFPNSPVYSYGHRNIFGLAFHPKTGKLYISEDGPEKNDEINIIEQGGNYGWPSVTGRVDAAEFVDPIISYTPTITPTQNVFVEGHLYFGSYNEGSVHKLTLGGTNYDRVLKDEIVYQGKSFGVIGVFYGPDKQFYVTTPNKILRFEPKKTS